MHITFLILYIISQTKSTMKYCKLFLGNGWVIHFFKKSLKNCLLCVCLFACVCVCLCVFLYLKWIEVQNSTFEQLRIFWWFLGFPSLPFPSSLRFCCSQWSVNNFLSSLGALQPMQHGLAEGCLFLPRLAHWHSTGPWSPWALVLSFLPRGTLLRGPPLWIASSLRKLLCLQRGL